MQNQSGSDYSSLMTIQPYIKLSIMVTLIHPVMFAEFIGFRCVWFIWHWHCRNLALLCLRNSETEFSGFCGVEFILPSAEQSLIQFYSNRFLSYSILLCPFSWVSQFSWVEPYFLLLQLYQVCRDGNPLTFAISTRCQTNAFSSGKEGTVSSTWSLTRDQKPMCNELFA